MDNKQNSFPGCQNVVKIFAHSTVSLPDGIVIGGAWPFTRIAWPSGNSRGATKPEYDLFQALEKAHAEIKSMRALMESKPPPEEMRNELIAKGWKPRKGNSTIWQSPGGGCWRGPAHAWHVMKNLPWPPMSEVDRQIAERSSLQ
jgi:hypothetical protein